MPTFPMFVAPVEPDAWHAVRSPGGYEWWYFDAEDPSTDTQVVGILLEGFVWHPQYLRRYGRYLRSPTTHTPPFASEYPCAYLCVYRGGKLLHQFMTQYPAERFSASSDTLDVRMGDNHLWRDAQGRVHLRLVGTPWKLTGRGPRTLHGQVLRADLCFAPQLPHAPLQRTFLSQEMTGAEHRWVIANPLCRTTGQITLEGAPAGAGTIEFAGLGYHDHNYGTAPLGPGLKRWVWGRALFDDRVFTFHHAVPRDDALGVETHLVEGDARALREMPTQKAQVDWSRRSPMLLAYPRQLSFDDALVLNNPRLLDSTPFYLRVVYDAQARSRRGTALCEVAYPHRLRWPVLGRMIEMSFDHRR